MLLRKTKEVRVEDIKEPQQGVATMITLKGGVYAYNKEYKIAFHNPNVINEILGVIEIGFFEGTDTYGYEFKPKMAIMPGDRTIFILEDTKEDEREYIKEYALQDYKYYDIVDTRKQKNIN
jgi:hypothetical protein